MGKITALTRQKRNPDRINVYLDGTFAFGLAAITAVSLRVGQTLTQSEIGRAAEEKTGARGLVTAWEKVLRDVKFELPSVGLPEINIDAALVNDPLARLERCRIEAETLQTDVRADEVRAFAVRFAEESGFKLDFDSFAIAALVQRAEREGSAIDVMCSRLFKDFAFGLKLISRGTGQTTFQLDRHAVDAPDKFLSDLVVNSYRHPEASSPSSAPHV